MAIADNLFGVNVYLKPPKPFQLPPEKIFFSVKVRFYWGREEKEIWKMLGNYSVILQECLASVGVDGAQELKGMH